MKVVMIGPSNLGPYHLAKFKAITRLIPNFTYIRVFLREFYRPWNKDIGKLPFRVLDLQKGEKIYDLLGKENTDALITVGYNHGTLLRAAQWAKKNDVISILQSDSSYIDYERCRIKEFVKKLIVKRLFDAAIVAGERSAEYVKSLGIPEKMIWKGVDVINNYHFSISDKKINVPNGFPENYFITVCRLSPEKNLYRLLNAFDVYRYAGGKWGLVIAGAGPSERELKENVPINLNESIHWYGWAGYDDLPSLYHGASCLILPSIREPWGLVVNEAMAAGLPVLISRNCGCLPELCHAGINGYDFDPFNIGKLAELMARMSSNKIDLEFMRKASKRIISNYTPEILAKTVVEMAETLLSRI